MKAIRILLYSSLLVLSSSLSYAQSWLWGKGGYGATYCNGYSSPVATDKYGNVYITGEYQPTIIFGKDTLHDAEYAAYLTKYNAEGSVIWTKQIISSYGGSFGYSVATDKTGNIYITGWFYGKARADTFPLTDSNGISDAFLVKYNADGKVLWARQSALPANPVSSLAQGSSVATDKMGNVFITGYFTSTVSFWPFTLNTDLKSISNTAVFLVKYDSKGNVVWAKQSEFLNETNVGAGTSVATDNSGNVYISGYFLGGVSFGNTELINHGLEACFLVKYSSSGNMLWAKQNADRYADNKCIPHAVITDRKGNPYITGSFADSVSFDSQHLYTPSTSTFFTKYDKNGTVLWSKQSSPGWIGTGLACDGKHIYMTGVTAPPDSVNSLKFGDYTLHTDHPTRTASFILKFDKSWNPSCGSIINNLGMSLNGVACDATGAHIYMASNFMNTVICGPDTLPSSGFHISTFVGRWENRK